MQGPQFFPTFIELINENSPVIALISGIGAFWLGIRNYNNNNAPAIVIEAIDNKKREITISNKGRGIAQNIEIEGYRYLVDIGEGKLDEWLLTFWPIGSLAPGEFAKIEMKDKSNMVFDILFFHFDPPGEREKNICIPVTIKYQNIEKSWYRTELEVKFKELRFLHFGRYGPISRILKSMKLKFEYRRKKTLNWFLFRGNKSGY